MPFTYLFGGIAVADFAAAVPWYERLFGRAADLVPTEGEAAWQLTETGWLYLLEQDGATGGAVHTLLVDDLEATLAELAERKVETGDVKTIPGAVTSCWVTDPEGNRIQIAQPLGPTT